MLSQTINYFSMSTLDNVRHAQPAWYNAAWGYAWLTVMCLLAMAIDDRLLNGVNVWTKPFKFALSISVYFATIAAMAQLLDRKTLETGLGRVLVWVPLIMAFFEIFYIFFMAAQGQPSHFNTSSPFHAAMYSLMGFGAVCLVLSLTWLAVLIARERSMHEPLIFAVVVSLIITTALGGGFGGYLGSQMGHWVQATPTDANGIWLFKWATDGGDLRVAHFFGMHAMQAIPLLALLLPSSWAANTKLAAVIAGTCAYSAFTIMTFVQAVNGQPFLPMG